jgi:hypothetical protein
MGQGLSPQLTENRVKSSLQETSWDVLYMVYLWQVICYPDTIPTPTPHEINLFYIIIYINNWRY